MDDRQADGQWTVLVEATVTGGGHPRREITHAFKTEDHATACAYAEHLARTHRPEHPRAIHARRIYRQNEHSWLVVLVGGLNQYYVRIDVAQYVDELPR
jgi:hypothetical protein